MGLSESFTYQDRSAQRAAGAPRLDIRTLTHQTHNTPVIRNGEVLKNWFKRSDCVNGESKNPIRYVATLQVFRAGGYEVLCKPIDLHEVARMADAPRKTGKREKDEDADQNPEDQARSVQRSKKKMRHKIHSIGCDRLLTLTHREKDQAIFKTKDWWAESWEKFLRIASKAGVQFEYVAVLEKHKKGNFHLHVALKGFMPVKRLRRIWCVCCGGRGMGNVDVKFRQDLPPMRRRKGLARYLSKYMAKQIGDVEFNKKRYWSSKHQLPDARRYILKAQDSDGALQELVEMLNLNPFELVKGVFTFKIWLDNQEMQGFGFGYEESYGLPPPF